MALTAGTLVLNDRYKLIKTMISLEGEGELWGALDEIEYAKPYLLKAWPFYEDRPDDVQRALWDAELRTLYRVRSTPGSEDSLLQLRDVGIDHELKCFVMVFETVGITPLASVLGGDRSERDWLSGRPTARRELWLMLSRLAEGLALLHDQQVVHRSVNAESVFLDPGKGPESSRLGGFEWSIRLGRPAAAQSSRVGWETPPEALNGRSAFGPDADWFAFGMLVARCMLSIEHLAAPSVTPLQRYRQVLSFLNKAKRKLTPLEIDLIERLIAEDPTVRYRHRLDIVGAIREVVRALEEAEAGDETDARHIVLISPGRQSLVEQCMERGLYDLLELEPGDTFDPNRADHVTALSTFLYRDFADGATLTPVANRDVYVLSGASLHLRIEPALNPFSEEPSWQNAFCSGAAPFASSSAEGQVTIPPGRLEFFSTKDIRARGDRLAASTGWEAILPRKNKVRERREDQERFYDFIRITNQIDILIRDAEVFRCQVTDVQDNDGRATVAAKEIPRRNEPLQMFKMDGGMAEFLLRELSSGKPNSNLVQLGSPETESITVHTDDPTWSIKEVDLAKNTATFEPEGEPYDLPSVGEELVLRTKGLGGQVLLIKRRKEAIQRLARHNYLLSSLSAPGQVLMDSGPVSLPVPLTEQMVDGSKLKQITKIMGVRPIYTVQGPPGTGKTHMVAWQLREILAEDPVAQILITAQAHPAVDVLRAKVEQEAFNDVPAERRPLAIRLRRTTAHQTSRQQMIEKGSEHQVTRELLEATITRLEEVMADAEPSDVQKAWLEACQDLLKEVKTGDAAVAKEFRELVKRSASITYSTASDGDLAALGAAEISYDWSIVEEAAKAHGFELALPLGLGHRWLLIGDPEQLPPYRIEDYQKAVLELDATVAALQSLGGADSLLDRDFLRQWRDRSDEHRSMFREYCHRWLKTFEKLHKLCAYHEPDQGLLTGQHRMHPDIGELISEAYYDGKLQHFTQDQETGRARPQILHGLSAPSELRDKAIIWLDIPPATRDPRFHEQSSPKYRNEAEIEALDRFLRSLRNDAPRPLDLAILSPYAQQVGLLRTTLNKPHFRSRLNGAGIRLAPDPRGSGGDRPDPGRDGFFTVDSFQGNQADIIAVSLVRNNTRLPGNGLGFLVEAPRMNVLISRAERLLILVGSWDFFKGQVSHVSLDPTVSDTLQHLARVIQRLETWFQEGRAVRISADLPNSEGEAR
jgi:serine/threonine protein kinase